LEKWLQHQPDRQKNYTDFIKEYEELGHMQLVSGGMDVTVRKYFTCLIIQYSNMTTAPPNSE
jgi:hypothetical protein